MSNCLLAYNNRADAAAYSGGSWRAGLPLTNLANPIQGIPARSTDTTTASTKFGVDVGVDKTTRLLALVNHNLSLNALVRIRAGSVADMTSGVMFDSGWFEAWPPVYGDGVLEWEQPNFWGGKYSDEEKAGYTWNVMKFQSYGMLARYWLVEIDDQANGAGYIDIGRLFVGDAWQPVINMAYGAGIAWEDPSGVDEAMSGTEFFDQRRPYRVARFSINGMSEDEGYGRAFDLFRRSGITKEVVFVYDPEDTLHLLRRQYRGRFRQLSQIENPSLDVHSAVFEIKEML